MICFGPLLWLIDSHEEDFYKKDNEN